MKESSNASGRPDPRVAWPEYAKRLEGICNRLLEIKAHIIVTSHYAEMGPDLTSIERTGGIVPLLGGKAKIRVPSLFQDIVFFEKNRNDNRVFNTAIRGVFGPGCRSLEGFKVVKGDVQALIRSFGTGAVDPADEEASRDDDTFIPKSFIPKSKTNKGSVRDGKA
jgi:hypothetical protein